MQSKTQTKPRVESNALALERTCYELCSTGAAMEAYGLLQLAKSKFVSLEDAMDIQQSLIEDFPDFRDLM